MTTEELAVRQNTEITEHDELEGMSVQALISQVKKIQTVMKSVMRKDVHYGTIPGCNKPSLLQAGADILALTFNLGSEATLEDLSDSETARFRATVRIFNKRTGLTLGVRYGECSSNEEKYRWKKAASQKEYEKALAQDMEGVRIKVFKTYEVKQVRTQPADVSHTVMVMAIKRGYVGGINRVTAAGEIFTDTIEDIPSEVLLPESRPEKPPITPPAKKEFTDAEKKAGADIKQMQEEMKSTLAEIAADRKFFKESGADAALNCVMDRFTLFLDSKNKKGGGA